ncbi:MAG TPA: WYL domain-containing protein [Candidatus Corynebacterium avicola]|uniref:WYL domain-containing protein n=1 Tax=Candidatus Corynebacterium avicola TaxID=2838527 RepID=A0A9D1UKG4_9CORY|nr:WYL domain-containing protein [Candidatus Corynebacterium avicola]
MTPAGPRHRNRPLEPHWDAASSRLINLVLALRGTARSTAWVTDHVHGYLPPLTGLSDEDTKRKQDSARRQFDRDRELLGDVGIEVEKITRTDSDGKPEEHFVIDPEVSDLAEFDLTPGEWDVLAASAHWVPNASLVPEVQAALTKLAADAPDGGVGPYADAPDMSGRVPDAQDLGNDDINTLVKALDRNLSLTFNYWPSLTSEPTERHLDPWAVAAVGANLYVTGHDRDRGAQRTFRLSRIADLEVGTDIIRHPAPDRPGADLVAEGLNSSSGVVTARVLFRDDGASASGAQELRAMATGPEEPHPEGTVRTIGPVARSLLLRKACEYAPDALVLSPPDLVTDVVKQLSGALETFSADSTATEEAP